MKQIKPFKKQQVHGDVIESIMSVYRYLGEKLIVLTLIVSATFLQNLVQFLSGKSWKTMINPHCRSFLSSSNTEFKICFLSSWKTLKTKKIIHLLHIQQAPKYRCLIPVSTKTTKKQVKTEELQTSQLIRKFLEWRTQERIVHSILQIYCFP